MAAPSKSANVHATSKKGQSNSDNKSAYSTSVPSKASKAIPLRKKALSPAKADALTLVNQTTSPLLRLSAELRNRIFTFAFSETLVIACFVGVLGPKPGYDVIPSNLLPFDPYGIRDSYPFRKMLARTTICRQIRAETADLPLLNNKFQVEDVETLEEMCVSMPLRVQEKMGSFTVALLSEPRRVSELYGLVSGLRKIGAQTIRVLTYEVLEKGHEMGWDMGKVDLLKKWMTEAGLEGKVELEGVWEIVGSAG